MLDFHCVKLKTVIWKIYVVSLLVIYYEVEILTDLLKKLVLSG